MNIRNAIRSDIPALSSLNHEIQTLHQAWRPDVFKLPDEEALQASFSIYFDNPKVLILLAEEGAQLIAYAICELHERAGNAFKHARRTLHVHQIAVVASSRRKGIGRALFKRIETLARQESVVAIELDMWMANEAARRFYSSLGLSTMKEVMELPVADHAGPLFQSAAQTSADAFTR
jgi:ribosomal protein S18 acetylase RimI-like enzyme